MGQTGSLPDYDPNDYKDDVDLDLNPTNYPNFGNYTMASCSLRDLAQLSQQEQMKFSDAITRRYALNDKFQRLQSGTKITPEVLGLINETSVGNMAFMAFHNPNTEWSQKYNELIALLRK